MQSVGHADACRFRAIAARTARNSVPYGASIAAAPLNPQHTSPSTFISSASGGGPIDLQGRESEKFWRCAAGPLESATAPGHLQNFWYSSLRPVGSPLTLG